MRPVRERARGGASLPEFSSSFSSELRVVPMPLHGDCKTPFNHLQYTRRTGVVERSLHDYTGEAFDGFDAEDVAELLQDRLAKARERLEEARESVKAICEPVTQPRDTLAYLRFFCGPGQRHQ